MACVVSILHLLCYNDLTPHISHIQRVCGNTLQPCPLTGTASNETCPARTINFSVACRARYLVYPFVVVGRFRLFVGDIIGASVAAGPVVFGKHAVENCVRNCHAPLPSCDVAQEAAAIHLADELVCTRNQLFRPLLDFKKLNSSTD